MKRPVALTGTPGTGKSSVASLLTNLHSVEVGELARQWGLARRSGRTLEIDLAALQRKTAGRTGLPAVDLVVGHLAHLLRLRDVIVLRCHPIELDRRLAIARRGSRASRGENVAAEATDTILIEAVRPGRRVWEIDTTGRSIASVATEVRERIRRRGRSQYGRVHWLEDAAVTDYLLDRNR